MWTDSFLGDGCETEVAPSLSCPPVPPLLLLGGKEGIGCAPVCMGGRTRTEDGGEGGEEGAPPERPACSMIVGISSAAPALRSCPFFHFNDGSWKSDNGRTDADGWMKWKRGEKLHTTQGSMRERRTDEKRGQKEETNEGRLARPGDRTAAGTAASRVGSMGAKCARRRQRCRRKVTMCFGCRAPQHFGAKGNRRRRQRQIS